MGGKKWYLSPLYLIRGFAGSIAKANTNRKANDEGDTRLLLDGNLVSGPNRTLSRMPPEHAEISTSIQLLFNGSWITRRIESIDIIDDKWIERHTSIQVSTGAIARILSLPLDGRELWVPIGVNRKEYYLKFDLVDAAGASVPLAGRDVDSEFTAAALCSLIPDPTESQLEAARELAFDMSGDKNSFLSLLPDKGQKVSDFAQLLSDHFCPVIRIQLDGRYKIYKMTRIEAHNPSLRNIGKKTCPIKSSSSKGDDSTEPQASGLGLKKTKVAVRESGKKQTKYPSISFIADFPYFGWAASEHVRVSSPEGTFFSSLHFASEEEKTYQITLRDLDRASIYHRSDLQQSSDSTRPEEWPSTHRLAVTIMPNRHGGLRGTLLLTWYVVLVLIIAGAVGLTQYHFSPAPLSVNGSQAKGIFEHLRGEPALTLGVVFPSILVGYFYVSTESRPRWLMLRRWRNLATWSLGTTLLMGLYILGAPEERASYQAMSWISLLAGFASIFFAARVTIWWRRISGELKHQDSLIGNSYDISSVWVASPERPSSPTKPSSIIRAP